MTSESECYVYIVLPGETEFVTAARFAVARTRDGEPIGTFVYGKKYLSRANAVELDPVELRLSDKSFQTARMNGFFGAIRDAMPDFWGRRVIERNAGMAGLDEFGYLMHGPDDRAGALGFGFNREPPAPRREFSRTLDLEALQEIAEAILDDNPAAIKNQTDARQIQQLLLEGTSMGGARPKAVVEDDNCLWIAKFSSPHDRWSHPRVEHAFLLMAHACGLNAADSKLVTVGGKDVLLVRRFDRDKTVHGYRRHRMVSALTLLKSEDIPDAKKDWSYLSLADEIRRASTSPEADLCELYRRMCFNAIVSNLDDHPRNHALLAKEEGWRLSPAYDLTPTLSIAQDSRLLAMECGLRGRVANRKNLLTACPRFLLREEQAQIMISEIVQTIRTEWDACLRRAGTSEVDCKLISSARLYDGFFYDSEDE
jgi:serine/threonine-protein kinase HipA